MLELPFLHCAAESAHLVVLVSVHLGPLVNITKGVTHTPAAAAAAAAYHQLLNCQTAAKLLVCVTMGCN
jgi:hypothetical protein